MEDEIERSQRGGSNKKLSEQQKAARADNTLRRMLGIQQKFRDIGDLIGGKKANG